MCLCVCVVGLCCGSLLALPESSRKGVPMWANITSTGLIIEVSSNGLLTRHTFKIQVDNIYAEMSLKFNCM